MGLGLRHAAGPIGNLYTARIDHPDVLAPLTVSVAENLEALLAAGTDNAQLRFGLASAYYSSGDLEQAVRHAKLAVEMQRDYSAAWRLLGQIDTALGRFEDAIVDFETGIEVAERGGDLQLVKEMTVFLRRLRHK